MQQHFKKNAVCELGLLQWLHPYAYVYTRQKLLGQVNSNIRRYAEETDGQTQEEKQTMDADGKI